MLTMQATIRSDRVAELMNRASESLQAGDHGRAMLCIRQALALRPGEAKAHRMVGQIYKLMGKDLLAQRSFHTADTLEQQPATPMGAGGAPAPAGISAPQTAVPVRRLDTPAAAPGMAAPRPVAAAAPAALAPDPFDLPEDEEVETRPQEFNRSQRRLVLDMAMQCLAQLTATEKLMQEKGLGVGAAFSTIDALREQLGDRVHQVRDAWRAEQAAQAAPPAQEPAEARYQRIGPFSHTLGTGQGAITEGEEVADLQKLLNLEGLHVQVTGKYGTTTTLAVRKFQDKYHLNQRNGVVGVETRRLLNRLVAQVSVWILPAGVLLGSSWPAIWV